MVFLLKLLLLSVILIIGGILLAPAETFRNPSYRILASIASERTWALATISGAYIAGFFWFSRLAILRHIAGFAVLFWFGFLALAYVQASPWSIVTPAWAAFAILSGYIAWREGSW